MSKVLVKDGYAKYVFDDSVTIDVMESCTCTSKMRIPDLNSSNTTLYEDVNDVPSDWVGDYYLYDGATWTVNPDWPIDDEQV